MCTTTYTASQKLCAADPVQTPLLSRYNFKEDLQKDITAGLTIGVVIIPQGEEHTRTPPAAANALYVISAVNPVVLPQGLAYALLAGLEPIYGVYSGIAPAVVYAFLGTSKQAAVGPMSMPDCHVSRSQLPTDLHVSPLDLTRWGRCRCLRSCRDPQSSGIQRSPAVHPLLLV